MCMPCLIASALMLFTPSGSDLSLSPNNSIPLAQDAQVAIVQVVDRLPSSAETQLLRNGLEQLKAKLATAKTDVEAKAILDRELVALAQQVGADPNSEVMTQALESLLMGDDQPILRQLQSHVIQQHQSRSLLAQAAGSSWGWLQ